MNNPETGSPWRLVALAGAILMITMGIRQTVGLVGKLFGPRYLATLFGLTLLTHQVGAFLGAWLGGVAVAREGSYLWIWYADAALALLAALVNLPIREERVGKPKGEKKGKGEAATGGY